MVLKCLKYNFGWHQGYSLFYKYTYICWYNAFLWSCISFIPTPYINDNHCKYPCSAKEVHLLFRHQMPYNVARVIELVSKKKQKIMCWHLIQQYQMYHVLYSCI